MAIIKSNKLIETSYKLNSREQFFVLYLISKISQHDSGFREYTMHYSEIEKIINFDGKRRIANKSEVFSLMDKLNSETIKYEKGNIVGKSVWLQHMEHNTDTDEFTFSLSEKLRDYLIQLKEHFTRYNISNIVYLNSSAIRLYEVLKRYQYKGSCELTVEKIKFYLGIEGRYSKFYEFKRWVLIPSQREIEKYTDIRFEYSPAKKEGKKIISLKFVIFENEPDFQPETMRLLSKIDPAVGEEVKLKSNQKLPKNEEGFSPSLSRSFEFLTEKGINKTFIKEKIFKHNKVNYEPLRGYEDIYFKMLWKFFSDKTNAEKPAGAFVSWWKKGTLTEDGLHARMVEYVINRKKAMTEKERKLRDQAQQDLQNSDSLTIGQIDITNPFKNKKAGFNIEYFKRSHPDTYQRILKQVKEEYESTFKALNQVFHPEKYRKAIEDKVYHNCLEWYQKEAV